MADSKHHSQTTPLLTDHRSGGLSYSRFEDASPSDVSLSPSSTLTDASSLLEEPAQLNQFSRADVIWILAGLWSAVFLGSLDGTIVATLLTPIGSDFNKANQSSYIGTAYLLSVCCFTPLYGRLADILGRKGAMLLGLSLFGSGTMLCGIAPSMEALIAARALAGMGGGGSATVSSVAVTDLIPLKQRGLYQGLANILFGLGAGVGGPLGGWINDALGWRYAFLLQAPILLFSITLVALKVNIRLPAEVENRSFRERLRRIDLLGSLTLVGTVGSLLLGFSLKSTEELPWSHPVVWGLLSASVVWGALFILVEHKYAAYPVMPLRLMRRNPLFVSLANLFASMAAFSMLTCNSLSLQLYHVPMYFSAVRLQSATNSGLHLLPHSVYADECVQTGSVFAGWLMRRTGKLHTLTVISAGLSILANVLISFWNERTGWFHLWFDIVPQAFGMASLITTTLIAMIASVRKDDMAVATGITYLFRTTGQVLGVSLGGAVLQSVLLQNLRARITGPGAAEVRRSWLFCESLDEHSTSIIPDLEPALGGAAVDSYAGALRVVFICQAACAMLGFMFVIPIRENPLP
ncbi:vacuolar amino acid permease [Pterulicium gracile]|uniref:Vacuolar amino acid permease n=1 Tax=Pterulicium gracile TaxID=1884261 RepID=A0A5C3QC08_9AGAR|nr:vacuolar amino acid permease [Pterula gracilis]